MKRRTPMQALEIANKRWWKGDTPCAPTATPMEPTKTGQKAASATTPVTARGAVNANAANAFAGPSPRTKTVIVSATPDPHEEFRRILTRDQERAIVEFFYPHRGCSWCNESGWMVVDGKRVKCMGRDES